MAKDGALVTQRLWTTRTARAQWGCRCGWQWRPQRPMRHQDIKRKSWIKLTITLSNDILSLPLHCLPLPSRYIMHSVVQTIMIVSMWMHRPPLRPHHRPLQQCVVTSLSNSLQYFSWVARYIVGNISCLTKMPKMMFCPFYFKNGLIGQWRPGFQLVFNQGCRMSNSSERHGLKDCALCWVCLV